MVSSLKATAKFSRVIVNFDHYLDSPREQLGRIGDALGFVAAPNLVQDYVKTFLDPSLRHSQYISEDLLIDRSIFPLIQRLHALLQDLSIDSTVSGDLIQTICSEVDELAPLLGYVDKINVQISQLDQQVHVLNEHVAQRDSQIESYKAHVTHLESVVVDRDVQISQLDQQVHVLNEHVAQRDSQIESYKAHVTHLESVVVDRDVQISQLDQQVHVLNEHVAQRDSQIQLNILTIENLADEQKQLQLKRQLVINAILNSKLN
jgi:hypothetical protein